MGGDRMKFKLLSVRVDAQGCTVNVSFDQMKYSEGRWVPGRSDVWIPVSRADASMLCHCIDEEVNVSVYPLAPSVSPPTEASVEDRPGT